MGTFCEERNRLRQLRLRDVWDWDDDVNEGGGEDDRHVAIEEVKSDILSHESQPYRCDSISSDATRLRYVPHDKPDRCLSELAVSEDELGASVSFPPITDPGIDAALYPRPRPQRQDASGSMGYAEFCRMHKITPISKLTCQLQTEEVSLQYCGANQLNVRAICSALTKNLTVHSLDLTGTRLNMDCCAQLRSLILTNNVIETLNLTGCFIGHEGAEQLADGIRESIALNIVILRRCNISDRGAAAIANALAENHSVTELDLGWNNLGLATAIAFGKLLTINETLKHLELIWNNLYETDAIPVLVKGVIKNQTLEYLGLAWNALSGFDLGVSLSTMFKKNKSLRTVDLSYNRIDKKTFNKFANSLKKSQIEHLHIGDNPIGTEECNTLIQLATQMRSLKSLTMKHLWIDFEVKPLLQQARGSVKIEIEGIYRDPPNPEPIMKDICIHRANYLIDLKAPKKKKKKKKQPKLPSLLGYFMHTIIDEKITVMDKTEFVNRLRLAKYKKLDQDLLDAWMDEYPAAKQAQVSCLLLAKEYLKMHPTGRAPPPLPKKEKKKKKGKGGKKGKKGKSKV